MTAPTPDPDGYRITTKDVWQELVHMRAEMSSTIANAAMVPDHEARIRQLEKWKYALPPTILLAVGSVAAEVVRLLVMK